MEGFDSRFNHRKGGKLRSSWPQACALAVMALIIMPLAQANAGKANSAERVA